MTSRSNSSPKRGILAAVLFATTTLPALVNADSACKGVEEPLCVGRPDCIWVSSYVRSDGQRVSGYCRVKGTKSKTSSTMTSTVKDAPAARE